MGEIEPKITFWGRQLHIMGFRQPRTAHRYQLLHALHSCSLQPSCSDRLGGVTANLL